MRQRFGQERLALQSNSSLLSSLALHDQHSIFNAPSRDDVHTGGLSTRQHDQNISDSNGNLEPHGEQRMHCVSSCFSR